MVKSIFLKILHFFKFFRDHLKFFLFIGLIYQTIYLKINYFKYETVASIQSDYYVKNLPAISFCLKSKKQIELINRKREIKHSVILSVEVLILWELDSMEIGKDTFQNC
jgi:hypothetical protein